MKKGWHTKTLGDVCHVYQPETISQKQMAGGEFPVYGANGQIGWHNQFNHDEPQLILGCRGSCGAVHFTQPRAWINGNAMVVQPNPGVVDPFYLAYALKGGIDLADAITGTAQPQITRTSLMPLAIALPESIAEQQRIVALLDEAFAGLATARANAERNLQNAHWIYETHLQSIFNAQGNEWEEGTVKSIARPGKGSIRTGPFGSQLLHSEFVDEGIAVLGIDNAVNNHFRWGKCRFITPEKYEQLKRYTVHPGDVLITIMGTCGRCAVVPDDIPTAINTKHLCCITLDRDQCLPDYLHIYFLHAPQSQRYLAKHAKGAIMAGLNMGLIQDLPVLLPPVRIQEEIIRNTSTLREETQRLTHIYERKLAALEELKKSLLQQAFNGEL